jgi:hypothetical protein
MPNFVGTATLQSAANQLRGSLGQSLNVGAPGGAAYANELVGRQEPAAGTLINSASSIRFWPAATSATPTAAPTATGTFTAGTYTVGVDIQPGTYTTPGSSWCYWKRLRDDSNELGSIIANDIVNGRGRMTVKASDRFVTFDGTCVWTRQ